jgi:hypothetical protein
VFHVGQKVVCINVAPGRDGLVPRYRGIALPALGGVYTIRDIFDARRYGHDDLGLLMEEIVNPIRRYISEHGPVTCEQFWLSYRFRPLRTTNIDVFLKMLEPARERIDFVGFATTKNPRPKRRSVPRAWRRSPR